MKDSASLATQTRTGLPRSHARLCHRCDGAQLRNLWKKQRLEKRGICSLSIRHQQTRKECESPWSGITRLTRVLAGTKETSILLFLLFDRRVGEGGWNGSAHPRPRWDRCVYATRKSRK